MPRIDQTPWHTRPTIGVLAGWQFYRTATNLSYLKPVFNGIRHAAQALGCNVLFGCGMGASANPADPIRPAWPIFAPDVDYVPIGMDNTDGLIVFNPLHSQGRATFIQNLRAAGHPVLFIGSGEDGPTITVDNYAGIFEAVEHLVQHGHREIAFLAGSPDDLQGDSGERLRAYHAALAHFGLASSPQTVVYGRHVFDGGYAGVQQILDSGAAFSALLASNDEMALGAIQALKALGRRVPQDVAVIGFDNRLEGTTQEPGLSTVHVPLYEMGHRAVAQMKQHLDGTCALNGVLKMNTRLVRRESCGCSTSRRLPAAEQLHQLALFRDRATLQTQLVEWVATTILNQAHSLSENECRSLCRQVVEAFFASIDQHSPAEFLQTLDAVLERTITGGDYANIWQDAVTYLQKSAETLHLPDPASILLIKESLDQARLVISAQMQQQHQHMIVNQRWSSSRLSLLTASLQTTLDENRIYEILEQHLKDMDIHLALVVLFDPQDEAAPAWSTLRDGIHPEQEPVRFATPEFPPRGLFDEHEPVQLVLVPLIDQNSQLGYVVFGTKYLDTYGFIVQQLGGAFNTARLYRQATQGRLMAEEANRMKSRFLSAISHELRTPLNLIVGLSGMVIRDSDEGELLLPEAARKDLDRIHAYSQHLGGLIGDVIDLATSGVGQLRLNNEIINLAEVLRMVADSGSQLAADKGLAWEANLTERGPWVWGDQTRLRQVALNLINNAIKFTPTGSVRLKIDDHGDSVTVQVIDTGLGISPAEQEAIFHEFWQSERIIARGYGGLGVGLAISKRLVEMHGGTLSVESTGEEGAGSTFSFTLPTIAAPLKDPQPPEKPRAVQSSVVVLTNQPGSCERLCEKLHERGFAVRIAMMQRGLEWLSRIIDQHPDAIIVDVSTDTALGWVVLKNIKSKKNFSGIPVLLYSASQPAGSLLALDYLTKPIELSELTSALDKHWLMKDTYQPTRTILVVDDDPNTLEMHARIVQAQAATNNVLKARNGKEAIELLHQQVVDLVILDLQMPELDGFQVLERMREMENVRKTPVIVVTGKNLTEADMARLNQGVATVLSKGIFSSEETISHINAALENKRRLSSEAQRLVRIAMVYLHENYTEALSRRDIAQHVGISEDHLTFCFRQELGTTPIEYLQRYRINQAKQLLKETGQTITEIAQNVGFSDSGYFGRIFRRETGMNPDAFRRS